MTERRRRWVPIAIGVAFLFACFAIGMIVVSMTIFAPDMTTSTEVEAAGAFDEVLRRFGDRPALLEIRGGRAHRVSGGERPPSTIALQSMKVLAWDPGDNDLARMTLPFWFLRLKSGPVRFGSYVSGINGFADGSSLSVEDLEAHGPGLVLDHTSSRGERVLVWLE